MKYLEFVNSLPNTHILKTKFVNLNNYLNNRYGTYDLLYPKDEFNSYLMGLLLSYQNMLQDIELAITTRNSNTYNLENFGDKEKLSKTGKSVLEGVNSLNYKGYEVLGEFERKNENNTNTNTESVENIRSNMLDIVSMLESDKNQLEWYKFENDFSKLLITITAITF